MATSERARRPARCSNCEYPTKKLARLVRFSNLGDRLTLRVCRFCYEQLAPDARPRHRLR